VVLVVGHNEALRDLCVQVDTLTKENTALREGRIPAEIDVDEMSDTSDNRDALHVQLAQHNVS